MSLLTLLQLNTQEEATADGHPEYILVWAGRTHVHRLDERFPLIWGLTREDGEDVGVPDSMPIVVKDLSGGTVASLAPDTITDAAPAHVLVADFGPAGATGVYYATIVVSHGLRVTSHRQPLTIID